MKTKIKVFFTILSFVFITACEPQMVEVDNVQIEPDSVRIDLKIKNPNFFTVKLSNIVMDITVDQYKFKDVQYKPEIKLKPFSEKFYPIAVDVHPKKNMLASAGAYMALLSQDSTKLNVKGFVTVKVLLIKFKAKFDKTLYIKYQK